MDPAGLLISIATIAYTLDELSEGYSSASSTLSLIKSQVKLLETGATRIQEWLWFTDPTSQMVVMHSLRDAIATVNSSLERLQGDITEITHTGPKTARLLGRTRSDQWVKTKFAYNEGRMRKHLTDVRECASLMYFTLNVCQLPVGKNAEQEVRELEMGAKALHRAQTSARQQRKGQLQISNEPQEHSKDYNTFMKQVLEAESELPEEEAAPVLNRLDSGASTMTSASLIPEPLNLSSSQPASSAIAPSLQQPVRDRDELHLDSSGYGIAVATRPATVEDGFDFGDLSPVRSRPADHARTQDEDLTPLAQDTSGNDPPPEPLASPPPIPLKSRERRVSTYYADPNISRPQTTRNPVSRAAIAGSSSTVQKASPPTEKLPRAATDRTTAASPADSAFSTAEKPMLLNQSMSSLAVSEHTNEDLDQPPEQFHSDYPPVYTTAGVAARGSREALPIRRKDTARSSQLDDSCPFVVRLARDNRKNDLLAYLKGDANANEADPRTGCTALMEAARFRRCDICRMLLQSGAKVYLKDYLEGNTALHVAAREGDSEICQMLLDANAQSQDCNRDGRTPLETAAAGGHTEAVVCIVNSMKTRKTNDPIMVRAFFEAVKLGDVPTIQVLLANDVKPKKLKESWKPTAYAAQSGSLPMLEVMLAQKCSLKDRSPAGWTPLHYAARYGQQSMLDKLLEMKLSWKAQTKKADETALHVSAAHGHTAAALALIAHKDANVTMKDADNQEPIHHAVRHGDTKLTARLIDEGAKLGGINKYGWKPIHLAAAYGHVSLLAECMTRGISIEERTTTPSFKPEKRTNAAARRGYWAEIRWPHSGARPLHLALEFSHDDVARMLISGGAKIDERDSRGWHPLHYAAFSCRPDMVELLLQKGAIPDEQTVDGHTARTLGFREYGLAADLSQRLLIVETLEAAMAGRKKSRFSALTGKACSTGQSKTATQRNLAWHTAQLAEALYQSNKADEEDDDDFSVDSAESGAANISLSPDEQGYTHSAQASSSQLVKA
ncbi:hypothetical protein LTR08_006906 [Meristemomyces frigidus]|nr:hypothetical protein LTR08_006906 [Meristemomyces frigidus]